MEILFKAKRKDTEEWVEGYAFPSVLGYELDRMIVREPYSLGTVVNIYEIDSDTVCVYIGLRDKKGNEVFESDKVYDPHENRIFIVVWDKEMARFVLCDKDGWMNADVARLFYCEVIGNVYDKESELC